jgi:site-specific DNA-cytosine methylase
MFLFILIKPGKINFMKYIAMAPLIGGMAIGNSLALNGQKPERILSYNEYSANDALLRNYWKDVPYSLINSETNTLEGIEDLNLIEQDIDLVSCVPFCAGLSMLNNGNRGVDNLSNDWMIRISEFAMQNIQPKAIIGENAPALFQETGKPVADKLQQTAKKYGYSTSLVYTSTSLHGIPQRRHRTFFILYKDGKNYPFNFPQNKKTETISEYLKKLENTLNTQNIRKNELDVPIRDLNKDPYWQYFKSVGINPREIKPIRKDVHRITLFQYLEKHNKLRDLLEFAKSQDGINPDFKKNFVNTFTRRVEKRENTNLGIWDDSPFLVYSNIIPAIITKNIVRMIHPYEDRYYTYREILHMMGMPLDFIFENPHEDLFKIPQNVPVNTARDITLEVLNHISGKTKPLMRSNINSIYYQNNLISNRQQTTSLIKSNIQLKTRLI